MLNILLGRSLSRVRVLTVLFTLVALMLPQLVLANPAPSTVPDGCVELNLEEDSNGNALAAGTVISNQWAADGVVISTNGSERHPVMLFDTANPTGGDTDIGTPNEDFGGPGIGEGGEAGTPGENSQDLGNALIISQDGSSANPNDYQGGGTITFSFDAAVTILWTDILDIEEANQGDVYLYDAAGTLVNSKSMEIYGDNSYQRLTFNEPGVTKMEIVFPGSGAVPQLAYCPQNPSAVGLSSLGTVANSGLTMALLSVALVLLSVATVRIWRQRQDELIQG